ncbi:hypothetical protein M0813_15934 [Anaeramoeba flamelloides]|uniref:Uncharacterized protein n=1 Tax=Anaeramoeba flamelloides TaxID=1746091 RepID=A0ABQ8Z0N2_9EUKA|nr:hypothetical protein M0813_15934 [Anaeramoeba flamelloides]
MNKKEIKKQAETLIRSTKEILNVLPTSPKPLSLMSQAEIYLSHLNDLVNLQNKTENQKNSKDHSDLLIQIAELTNELEEAREFYCVDSDENLNLSLSSDQDEQDEQNEQNEKNEQSNQKKEKRTKPKNLMEFSESEVKTVQSENDETFIDDDDLEDNFFEQKTFPQNNETKTISDDLDDIFKNDNDNENDNDNDYKSLKDLKNKQKSPLEARLTILFKSKEFGTFSLFIMLILFIIFLWWIFK